MKFAEDWRLTPTYSVGKILQFVRESLTTLVSYLHQTFATPCVHWEQFSNSSIAEEFVRIEEDRRKSLTK